MTKFQALFVLWLRHEKFQSCSWRALAAHYYNRYNRDGTVKDIKDRVKFEGCTFGGNQLEGIALEEEAFKILRPESLIMEPVDLFETDLTLLEVNLKRHYE